MKTENGKIIEATRGELLSKWLDEDWCEIMSFCEYIYSMEKSGVKITGGS